VCCSKFRRREQQDRLLAAAGHETALGSHQTALRYSGTDDAVALSMPAGVREQGGQSIGGGW
jgi:hypothetical protein